MLRLPLSFLGVSDPLVPWDTMITAVGLFVVVPLAAGWLMRVLLKSPGRIERLEAQLKLLSITALIATVLLLFMVQAQAILANPPGDCADCDPAAYSNLRNLCCGLSCGALVAGRARGGGALRTHRYLELL